MWKTFVNKPNQQKESLTLCDPFILGNDRVSHQLVPVWVFASQHSQNSLILEYSQNILYVCALITVVTVPSVLHVYGYRVYVMKSV